MLELPEVRTIGRQLRQEIIGKKIINVSGNFTDHKFTFYHGDPNKYKEYLASKRVTDIVDRNYYVEIEIEDYILNFRDGANIRYYMAGEKLPNKSKLLIEFEDGSFLNMTTSMYASVAVFSKKEGYDNEYYNLELNRVGPLDKEFTFEYFRSLLDEVTKKVSVKEFLATKQRILGIGNGVVQDIMFSARLHPKRKMNTLSENELKTLYDTVITTIDIMIKQNGRDTQKDIYGKDGGYHTILSSKTYKNGCPVCDSEIKKEQFLGGSIYYCPNCQK